MTNHMDILKEAVKITRERGLQYGNVEQVFDRTAKMASIMLNTEITAYEIAMIQVAVKMARLQESRTLDDNYIDAMNYLSIAAQFAPVHSGPVFTQSTEQEAIGIVDDGVVEIAKRFAPLRASQTATAEKPKQD